MYRHLFLFIRFIHKYADIEYVIVRFYLHCTAVSLYNVFDILQTNTVIFLFDDRQTILVEDKPSLIGIVRHIMRSLPVMTFSALTGFIQITDAVVTTGAISSTFHAESRVSVSSKSGNFTISVRVNITPNITATPKHISPEPMVYTL